MSGIVAIDARLIGARSTGDSTYWTCLIQALNGIETDLHFLLFSDRPKPEGIQLGPRFGWVHLPSSNRRWWSYVAFPLMARKRGAMALHTQYALSPLAKNGITTVHDVSFLIGPDWFQPKDRILLRLAVAGAVRRAKRIITVSHTSKKEIEDLLVAARGKVDVTYNACPPWVEPMERGSARAWAAKEFGIQRPFALTVSTRWPRKNMELAIQAVEGLPERIDLDLVLTGKAGWGDQSPGKRGKAVGYVSEAALSALYSAAEVYLCPSRHEGFGVPPLEAFQCGCPVMCSTGGALPEVAGNAAQVQAGWDPREWSASLAALLQDSGKLDSLRQSGYRRVRDFSWHASAEATLAIYRGAMQ